MARTKRTQRTQAKVRSGRDLLSTGSTLVNLACSGDVRGGFAKGLYFFVVGDSQSGKTFLTLTCLAEAAANADFSDYRFIYDDNENGALMNFEKFFGAAAAERIEPPYVDKKGNAVYSRSIEMFYANLYDSVVNADRPCIYVLDSMDALTSNAEEKKFHERRNAVRKGSEVKGDFGDGKAKINSRTMRSCVADLRDTGSILIVVNQTRDNINAGLFDPKKTRSGGKSLTFYATLEMWLSVGPQLKKMVRGKPRAVGTKSRVHVKKNRVVGKDRRVDVSIFYDYGIDDIGSCIDFLIENQQWERTKTGMIDTGRDLGLKPMTERKLVQEIERRDLELDLRYVTSECWNAIEDALKDERKPRYI